MSGRKNVIPPIELITLGDMSGDIISEPVRVQWLDNIGLQVKWASSDAVGVITVEGSNLLVDWDPLTFDPALAQPNSNNGQYGVALRGFCWAYVRVKYTRGSGTGALSVNLTAKEL